MTVVKNCIKLNERYFGTAPVLPRQATCAERLTAIFYPVVGLMGLAYQIYRLIG